MIYLGDFQEIYSGVTKQKQKIDGIWNRWYNILKIKYFKMYQPSVNINQNYLLKNNSNVVVCPSDKIHQSVVVIIIIKLISPSGNPDWLLALVVRLVSLLFSLNFNMILFAVKPVVSEPNKFV